MKLPSKNPATTIPKTGLIQHRITTTMIQNNIVLFLSKSDVYPKPVRTTPYFNLVKTPSGPSFMYVHILNVWAMYLLHLKVKGVFSLYMHIIANLLHCVKYVTVLLNIFDGQKKNPRKLPPTGVKVASAGTSRQGLRY
jgi:hypothetical protein